MSYLPISICLERYKRDCNGPWFIDRWPYDEGHCTITKLLPNIFTELSPLNHLVFFIMDACPSHIFKSTKGIEMEIGL